MQLHADWETVGSVTGTSSSTRRLDSTAGDVQAPVGAAALSRPSEGAGADQAVGTRVEAKAGMKAADDAPQV